MAVGAAAAVMGMRMAATKECDVAAASLAEFHASPAGVCGLVESGATAVPPSCHRSSFRQATAVRARRHLHRCDRRPSTAAAAAVGWGWWTVPQIFYGRIQLGGQPHQYEELHQYWPEEPHQYTHGEGYHCMQGTMSHHYNMDNVRNNEWADRDDERTVWDRSNLYVSMPIS
uniref:Uncharacterized protein n=1 Tax=Oryza sativa subsp. japonica TaxID=39947 RepID=Q7EYP4_ORYSJ|nr:hypothetical protein [Oryza sativa Japonica Group]BAD01390.1 hypothetical protein [Oryza sativa Japonica Group]